VLRRPSVHLDPRRKRVAAPDSRKQRDAVAARHVPVLIHVAELDGHYSAEGGTDSRLAPQPFEPADRVAADEFEIESRFFAARRTTCLWS